jgi:ankyrin repeat protein
MDKITNKFTQSNIGPRIPPHLNKYHLNDKKNDEDMIKKIFMSIEEGNIGKIHEEFNNNTSSFYVKDVNDESILHAIIKSSNLIKDEKYDLCKYVLKRGVPVNSYNKLNITPIHIASKMQLEKIVKLLLEKGANPSSLDNQDMNSLHYAVQSKVRQCEDKKVRKIIKKNISENKILKELFNFIVGYMHNDTVIQIYTNHIKNTLNSKNLYAMYFNDIIKIKENFEKNLMMIAMNNDISDEIKQKQIFDENFNTTKKIEELIKNDSKIKILNDLIIKPNTVNGWGPNKDTKRNILPYKNVQILMEQTINKYISLYDKIIDEYQNDINLLDNDSKKLSNNMDSMYTSLNNIIQLLNNYDNNIRSYSVTTGLPLIQFLNINNFNNIANIINMDIDNINRIDVEQIGNIVINHDHIQAFSKSIPVIYRGTKDDVDEWKSANERPTKYLLTIIQNTMPYNIYAVPKAQYFNNEIVYRPYTYVGPPITKPFLDKMNTIVKQIKNNADNIVNSSQDLIYQFKNNILVNIYDEHIKYQIIKMVNMSIYLKLLKDEFTEIYHKTVELNEYLDTLVNTPVRNEFLYLIHNAIYEIDNLNKILKSQESQINIVYNKIYNLNQKYVEIVYLLMLKSGNNYINSYNMIDINNESDPIYKFNGYSNPFFLRVMPSTLDDFPHKNIFSNNNDYIKHLIEKYISQITCSNYTTYYISNNENTDILNNNYFIYDNVNNRQRIAPKNANIKPKKGILYLYNNIRFNNIIGTFPLPDLINVNCEYMINETDYLDNENPATHLGNIGINEEKIINKKESAYPSIYPLLGYHFNIIKYCSIQHIIVNLYNKYETNDEIIKLKSVISNLGINEPESIIDVIIATFTNEILNAFINYQLSKSCKIISHQFTNTDTLKDDPENNQFKNIMLELHKNNLILIKNSDYLEKYNNFTMHMNEIIDSLLNRYVRRKDINLLLTADLVEKKVEEQNNDNVVNYMDNLCVTIKPELVKLLIKHRVNINQKNVAGETPLFYAIENQHYEIVKILLEDNKAHKNIMNKNGVSPYQLILLKLKEYYELFSDNQKTIFNLTAKSYNKIKEKLLKKPEYGNNVLLYAENIFPILITLINYNLLHMTNSYLRNWTYHNSQSLFNLLGNTSNISLSKQLMSSITPTNNVSTTRLLNNKIDDLEEEKKIYESRLRELNHQRDELNKEVKPVLLPTNYKMTYIETAITNITQKINEIIDQIENIKSSTKKSKQHNSKYINKLNNYNTDDTDASNEMNQFIKIINKNKYNSQYDIRLYQDIWNLYLKNIDNLNSLIYIHLMISKYMGYLINQKENNQINDVDFKTNIKLIEDWYDNIPIKFIKDYFELPQELNSDKITQIGMEEFEVDNYALDKVIDILVHTLKSTIFANLFYTIVKTITKYVEELISYEQFGNDDYGKYLDLYVEKIIYNKLDNTSDLMEYILDILPLKVIKYVLKIYSGNNDPEKKITSIDELFNPIKTIIMNNTIVPMNESSNLIKNLDEYIYPYFKDNIEIFVIESKNIIDNYFKNIMTEYNKIKILNLIVK